MSTSTTLPQRQRHLLQVEADGSGDVLVVRQSLRDDVGIVDDVAAEEQAAADCEDDVHGAAEGYEHSNNASHDWGRCEFATDMSIYEGTYGAR